MADALSPDTSSSIEGTPSRVAKPSGSIWSQTWQLARETIKNWIDDDAARLAAALAFYTLLSVAPLLILSVAIAGLIFGDEAARGQIAGELSSVVGPEAGESIQSIVANAETPSTGIISGIVGIVVLLFGASGVFGELQSALNTIWKVEAKPGRGIRGIIRDRFFSLTMVLSVAFLLLVSLVISAALAAMGSFFSHALPGGETLWQILNTLFALGVTTLLFALIFKVVPDIEVRFRDVWVGALVTAILFTLGKTLLGIYIGKSSITSAFGAAGSIVAFVIWVYYSSQVLFLGAEFTRSYALRHAGPVRPSEQAQPAT